MTGIIVTNDTTKGLVKLQEIESAYYNIGIRPGFYSKYSDTVVFENGDTWSVLNMEDFSSAGYKCNVVYIDHELNDEEKELAKSLAVWGPWNGYREW